MRHAGKCQETLASMRPVAMPNLAEMERKFCRLTQQYAYLLIQGSVLKK
jgi:hypothetical protein